MSGRLRQHLRLSICRTIPARYRTKVTHEQKTRATASPGAKSEQDGKREHPKARKPGILAAAQPEQARPSSDRRPAHDSDEHEARRTKPQSEEAVFPHQKRLQYWR